MNNKINLGISSCLLGERVRFDSGHKISKVVTKEWSPYFNFVPVCPEFGMGMPVPRPAIRLISNEERIALVETKNPSKDHTHTMIAYSKAKVSELETRQLCGYIVCSKSPTCGMERVKVYKTGGASNVGVGLYTSELMKQMPWLPVEEDGRLNDPVLKENFITRVYTLNDYHKSVGHRLSRGSIIAFHSRYKLTLMAHHPDSYKKLGRLVANIKNYDIEEFYQLYREGLMKAMTHRASRKSNTNVLMHLQGYFKRNLDKKEKTELHQVIDNYRVGLLPLLAPLTLIKHYLMTHPHKYLQEQKYIEPYPQELRLRYGL